MILTIINDKNIGILNCFSCKWKKRAILEILFSRHAELVSASLPMEEKSFTIGVSGSCFIQHKKQRA